MFSFIGMATFENIIVHKLLRLRIFSFLGGIISLLGFTFFIITLRHIWIEKTYRTTSGPFKMVRHPLHLGIIVFLAGTCIYLASFASLCVLVWYLKTFGAKFKALDGELATNTDYFAKTRSGIPFMGQI